MERFARLLDTLVLTRARNEKLALIAAYLRETPDPDRGWAMAAMTGEADVPNVSASVVRDLVATRVDPVLFELSRQFVGDTAETAALIWPVSDEARPPGPAPGPAGVVEALRTSARRDAPAVLADLLDRTDASGRFAIMKLAMGNLRVGVSARLAKTALAQAFDVSLEAVEEYWHVCRPPYQAIFDWAAKGAPPPDLTQRTRFRPFMLAAPLESREIDLREHAAEWKWDGIRVQITRAGGGARLFSRGGEDISAAFPDVLDGLPPGLTLDGELLVRGAVQGGEAGSFAELQKRLGRKSPGKALLAQSPAFVRLYDILEHEGADVRPLPWTARRALLERVAADLPGERFDVSALIEAVDFAALQALRDGARAAAIEGVMLKRRDSPYVGGRKIGLWWKWKRDALAVDCVLMYAQRGNGKRASFFSDYTFGCWTDDGRLLPVGKAYSGFSDEELVRLDKFVRANTIGRFGPVVEVEKTLVLEVAFDAVQASARHKSGLAMRFPRIKRIRFDKPAAEADTIATLTAMIG
jgi:DNA ligase-1